MCGVVALIAGVPSWLAARRAHSDRAADMAAATRTAEAGLEQAVQRALTDLRRRHERLARSVAPADPPARWFDALADVAPPGGGAQALPVADDGPAAWAGRDFPRPLDLLAQLRQPGSDGTAAAGASDGRRWWCVAGARLHDREVLLAVPLGVMDPALGALADPGPIGAVAAAVGVHLRPLMGDRPPPAGGAVVVVPRAGPPLLEAHVEVPPAATRAALWHARWSARAALWLGLMVLALTAAAGQRLRVSAWPFHTQRWIGVALPWAARAALSLLGVPPRVETVLWLSPAAYAADGFALLGGVTVPLGPFAAWFATPFDLWLTALAALASAGVAATRAKSGATIVTAAVTPGRAWVTLVAGLAGARLLFAAPALVIASLETGAGVELYPSDRFAAASAELVLVAALAMVGLATVLCWGKLGSRLLDAAAVLRPDVWSRRGVALAGLALALVPLEGAPLGLRLLGFGVAVAATWLHRQPLVREDTGLAPALLRLLCGALLVHAVFEVSLDRARETASERAVHNAAAAAARLAAVAETAVRFAADPELVATCRLAGTMPYSDDPDEQRNFRLAWAPAAVPLWSRHVPEGFQRRGVVQVTLARGDGVPERPLFHFGIDAPGALAGLPAIAAHSAPPRRLTIGDTALRAFEARAPVGPPDAPVAWAAVVAPDPDDPVTAEAPRRLPALELPGLAGRPLVARFRDGACVVASDPRLERDRPSPGLLPEAEWSGPGRPLAAARIDDTPFRFAVRTEPDGSTVMAGLPAPEPGPTALRFARLLLVALLVGACAWVAARRARWWFDLPGLPRWRRRVKHLLVMAFLFVTV
ncbi:MAG: hypothetical protein ACYTGX_03065, partial [Planctomycetota bacterium]